MAVTLGYYDLRTDHLHRSRPVTTDPRDRMFTILLLKHGRVSKEASRCVLGVYIEYYMKITPLFENVAYI